MLETASGESHIELAADIVSAYVSNNTVPASELPAGLDGSLPDRADHVQGAFRIILEFIPQDALTAVQGIPEADRPARQAGKTLRRKKRLCKETLQASGATDQIAVIDRQLFQAEHGDDVLQLFVMGQSPADFTGEIIMAPADDGGIDHFRAGLQRIYGRIDALASQLS